LAAQVAEYLALAQALAQHSRGELHGLIARAMPERRHDAVESVECEAHDAHRGRLFDRAAQLADQELRFGSPDRLS
jgi:hypothetical protein